MFAFLMRLIDSAESRTATKVQVVIANLRYSEHMACEKGYTDVADRILAILRDLEREYGSGAIDQSGR